MGAASTPFVSAKALRPTAKRRNMTALMLVLSVWRTKKETKEKYSKIKIGRVKKRTLPILKSLRFTAMTPNENVRRHFDLATRFG